MELTFIEEEIPKITRAGGSGREAEPWELHIAPLKEADKAGKDFRVWTYSNRASGVSRMSSVRERLTKAVPTEDWRLAVRAVPGTEKAVHPAGTVNGDGVDISGTSATQYGVYVSYSGTFTDEQVVENARKHQERSERVKAARAKAEAERQAAAGAGTPAEPDTNVGTPDMATEPGTAELTAKERVAAARQKQAS